MLRIKWIRKSLEEYKAPGLIFPFVQHVICDVDIAMHKAFYSLHMFYLFLWQSSVTDSLWYVQYPASVTSTSDLIASFGDQLRSYCILMDLRLLLNIQLKADVRWIKMVEFWFRYWLNERKRHNHVPSIVYKLDITSYRFRFVKIDRD